MTSADQSSRARVLLQLARVAQLATSADGVVAAEVIPSGFPSLDRALGGGFRRGGLHVLGGDVSAGCSALALGMTLRTKSRTLYLTGESTAERILERALAMTARVSMDVIQLRAANEAQEAQLRVAALDLRDRVPVVEGLHGDGVSQVKSALDAHPDIELLVVDGLESLVPDHSSSLVARSELAADAVLALKRLAMERSVAVLLVTHLTGLEPTRADPRPRLADFGVDRAIAVHADVMLGLFREELYDGDIGVTGAAEVLVLKHRDGATGYVDLYFHAEWMRFEEVFDELAPPAPALF